MTDLIKIRRDTAANWTSANPVLHSGELGGETDTGKIKLGDGATAWNALGYVSGGNATTTKGDLLVRGSGAVLVRHAVGADGTVVMADSSQSDGIAYQALNDSHVAPVAPNDQTGTTYTFVLADKHRLVTGSNAAAQTFTIPPNSSVAYPLGTALQLYQKGAGQITIAAGAGVTIRIPHGAKTSAQYAVVTMIQVVADVWVISGDTTT